MHYLKKLIIALRALHGRKTNNSQYFLQITSAESSISNLRKLLIQNLNHLGLQAQQLKVFRLPEGKYCLSVLLHLSAHLQQNFNQMAISLSQHHDVNQIKWGLRRKTMASHAH
ncbi:hypothetical protein [Iodobacter sp.]|uniref:hypothetical protein n=1 Tax=Iodobacter sp. TaxID=1915058 RepID=UPI0025CB84FC|nr:hypothetical protein [Iodobacter sp.]